MNKYLNNAWGGLGMNGTFGCSHEFKNEEIVFLAHALQVPVFHNLILPPLSVLKTRYNCRNVPSKVDFLHTCSYDEIKNVNNGVEFCSSLPDDGNETVIAAKWVVTHLDFITNKCGVDTICCSVKEAQLFVYFRASHFCVAVVNRGTIFELER
jgi:hypothetical protein